MKSNGDYPVRKIILIIIFILMVLGAYVSLMFNIFKPYYEVYVGDKFIGYYSSRAEYDAEYIKAIDCSNEEYETTKYLAAEPRFERVFVKTKRIKQVDNQMLITDNLQTDYTVYGIIVNNEEKMIICLVVLKKRKNNVLSKDIVEAIKKLEKKLDDSWKKSKEIDLC